MLRRPSLRSQLNQIRLWVRQGRTDAWIAHKLDISVDQLESFKRDHGLNGEPAREPEGGELASADEAPAGLETEIPEPEIRPEEDLDIGEEPAEEEEPDADRYAEREPDEEPRRRRRRSRRGGRRRPAKRGDTYEATFEHGGEGYGLWFDPAVADSELYLEHWAGHRAVEVTIEADTITIRRAEPDQDAEDSE